MAALLILRISSITLLVLVLKARPAIAPAAANCEQWAIRAKGILETNLPKWLAVLSLIRVGSNGVPVYMPNAAQECPTPWEGAFTEEIMQRAAKEVEAIKELHSTSQPFASGFTPVNAPSRSSWAENEFVHKVLTSFVDYEQVAMFAYNFPIVFEIHPAGAPCPIDNLPGGEALRGPLKQLAQLILSDPILNRPFEQAALGQRKQ